MGSVRARWWKAPWRKASCLRPLSTGLAGWRLENAVSASCDTIAMVNCSPMGMEL